jgi:glycosyltransferase involved in cell wall biosynthesis
MKTKISIDARWLGGGIGTYTRQILQGLSKRGNGFEVHAITKEQYKTEMKQWCPRVTVVDTPIYTIREQWEIPRAANGCDLLHVPHFDAPLLQRGPLVITIHDLIHITDPEYRAKFKAWACAWPLLRLAARKAARIITDSEYSKVQIGQRLGVPSSKVTVISCGVSKEYLPMDRKDASKAISALLKINEPYLLYVGSLKRYKNVSTLLQAFAMLHRQRQIPHRLLIVGNTGPAKREWLEECAQLGISERADVMSHVEQELLPNLYAAADILVMPSKIEGFGLPVLEAMACGTPVISSRAASLPEVGGDAVVYFDPNSAEDLADAIKRVLISVELRENLRTKGLARAAQFTWEDSVQKHIQVYREVLGV